MVGSAWMPWVRPMVGVCLNSSARVRRTSARRTIPSDDGGGFSELEGLGGVDDVGGGEAVVEPAGGVGICDVLGDGGGEGDYVVSDFGFDLLDARDGEAAAIADGVGGDLGHDACGGEGLGSCDFDAEPAAVFVFVGPDAAHLGQRVAGDHVWVPGAVCQLYLTCARLERSSCVARGIERD